MLSEWIKSAAMRNGLVVRRAPPDDRVRAVLALLHSAETALPLIRLGGDGDDGFLVPDLLDATLLRRDRAEALGPVTRFPYPLDRSNTPGLPDPSLPPALRGQPDQYRIHEAIETKRIPQ